MSQRGWSWAIGGGIALVALAFLLTTLPVIGEARTMEGSATAVAIVNPIGSGPEADCIDVAFTATISYTARRPVIDLWGFGRAQNVIVDPARLEAAARSECADEIGSVEATAYLNAPTCESGLCEGAYLDYMTGQDEVGTESFTNFDGERQLPDSGVVRNEWCLEFAADVAYARVSGGGVSDSARVTDSDLCLDLS